MGASFFPSFCYIIIYNLYIYIYLFIYPSIHLSCSIIFSIFSIISTICWQWDHPSPPPGSPRAIAPKPRFEPGGVARVHVSVLGMYCGLFLLAHRSNLLRPIQSKFELRAEPTGNCKIGTNLCAISYLYIYMYLSIYLSVCLSVCLY